MFPVRPKLFAFAAAALLCAVSARDANAGWVTIKNDTNKPIVVQEVVLLNGRAVRGKPIKLLPGESFREFKNVPAENSYEVYDFAKPTPPIWMGKLNCKADSQSFAVQTVQGKIGVVSIPDPKKP